MDAEKKLQNSERATLKESTAKVFLGVKLHSILAFVIVDYVEALKDELLEI